MDFEPPGPEEQAWQIRALILHQQSALREHDCWYVLSVRWWDAWKDYVGFSLGDRTDAKGAADAAEVVLEESDKERLLAGRPLPTLRASVRPPPIENSALLLDGTRLRRGLQEYADFVLVLRDVWEHLCRWYGGGPEVRRTVVRVGEGPCSELRVELYPLSVAVCRVDPKGEPDYSSAINVTFARSARAKDLLQSVCDGWGLAPDACGEEGVRLWCRRGIGAETMADSASFDGWEILRPLDRSLEDLGVADDSQLLLEQAKGVTTQYPTYGAKSAPEWPMFRRLRLEYRNRTFKDPRDPAVQLEVDDKIDASVEAEKETYNYETTRVATWYPATVVAVENQRILVQFHNREKPKAKLPALLMDGSWLSGEKQLTAEAKSALETVFKRYATGGRIDKAALRGLMSCATNMLVQEDSWQVSDLLNKYGVGGQVVELGGFLDYWKTKAVNNNAWLEDELSRLFERVGTGGPGQSEEEKLLAQGREWFPLSSQRLAPYRTKEYPYSALREKLSFRDFRKYDPLDANLGGEWKQCEVAEVNWEEVTVLVQVRSSGSSTWTSGQRTEREWIPMESARLAEFETKSLEVAEDLPKPLIARTTSHGGVCQRPGACGLQNLGNTCFMNATLQCLSNCGALRAFFAGGPDHAPAFHAQLSSSPLSTNGRLAREFGRLLGQMWANTQESCAPTELKALIGQKRPEFSGFQQQDAQELLIFLLDGLHEDVNRAPYPRPLMAEVEARGRPDHEVAGEAWQGHLRRNDSKIVQLFQFQIRSEVECPACRSISVTFDPIMYLSLPVPKPPHAVSVTVMPVDYPQVPMQRIDIAVPKGASIEELEQRLWAQLGRQPAQLPSRFVFADVFTERVYTMFRMETRIDDLGQGDNIYAIEVPLPRGLPAGAVPTFVPVIFRSQQRSTYAYSSSPYTFERCAPPRILCTTADTTNAEVRRQLGVLASGLLGLLRKGGGRRPEEEQGPDFDIVTQVDAYSSIKGEPLPDDDSLFQLPAKLHTGVNFPAEAVAGLQAALPELAPVLGGIGRSGEAAGVASFGGTTLHQCLLKNGEREQLAEEDSVFCRKCKEHRRCWKKIELWSLPPQLIVHLKRFGRERLDGPITKITTPVEFPQELDLSAYLAQAQPGALYELAGVVNHHGGLGGGHYTAHALVTPVHDSGEGERGPDGEWFRFDDSRASQASASDIDFAAGYILFYRQRKPRRQ